MFFGTRRILVFVLLLVAMVVSGGCQKKSASEVEALASSVLGAAEGQRLFAHDSLAASFPALKGKVVLAADASGVWDALKGKNERKLVEEMVKANVRLIALPPEMGGKQAPAGSLLEDLTNAGNHELFSALYLDKGLLLIALTDPAYRIEDSQVAQIMAYARAKLSGAGGGALPAGFDAPTFQEAIVDVRLSGPDGYNRNIGTIRGTGANAKAALDSALDRTARKMTQSNIGADYLGTAVITINFLRERGLVKLRDRAMFNQAALGIDGFVVEIPAAGDKKEASIIIPPDRSMVFRAKDIADLIEKGLSNARMEKEAWKGEGAVIRKFRTLDLTELSPGGETVRLFRGVPYVAPEQMTVPVARESFKSGADWLLANFDTESRMFKYEYYAMRDLWRTQSYNIIRHGLATLTLIQAYELYGDERFLDASRLAIEWVLDLVEWQDDFAIFAHPKYDRQYKLGGAGVMLQAMCEYVRFRPMPAWDRVMRGFGNFIVHLQKDNGHYWSFYTKPGEKKNDREVTIYPGEANLALVRLYHLTKDKKYLDTVEKAFQYYSKWFNKNKNPRSKGNLGAFVPWDMSAMAEYWEIVKRDDVAEYAYQMADWIIDNWYVWGDEETYWKDTVGGFQGARRKNNIPLWNSGVYGEGIVSVYHMANLKGDTEKVEKYRKAAFLTMRFIRNIQYRPGSVYHLPGPAGAMGAIPSVFSMDDCRLDYAYHCLTVNYRALRFFSDADWRAVGIEPPQAN